MATEVSLPALGESVTEGTVTQWLKSVGDDVSMDEPLLEVSTDKVDTEIPSPVAGTLLEIRAAEDETVEVGAVLAVIGDAGESSGASGESSDAAEDPDKKPAQPAAEASLEDSAASDSPSEGRDQQGDDDAREPARVSGSGAETTEVTLPALGESVTEGTVTQWLKSVGDDVSIDEPLLEVSTDKVDTEIPSPVAGTLVDIVVSEDETVEVGAVLARIGPKGAAVSEDGQQAEQSTEKPGSESKPEPESEPEPESGSEPESESEPEPEPVRRAESRSAPEPRQPEQPRSEQPKAREPQQQRSAAPAAAEPSGADRDAGGTEGGPSYVTPLVRKLASKHGVDLSTLTGTGVGGRIRKQDVVAAAEAAERSRQQPAPSEQPARPAAQQPAAAAAAAPDLSHLRGRTEKLSRLRKVIAARMTESLQISAQLTTVVEVDVTQIARLRNRVKAGFEQREGVKLSFLPFFAKAAIDALKTYPQVNASIDTDAGTVTYHDAEHLGVAVDTERGLLVPVIKNAGDLSIAGLARKIQDLAQRTRDNQVSPDELSGGTFTLTNTGSRGALFDTPIINQPQVGILGTGIVVKRPVVIDDPNLGETIAVRQMAFLALTYDHRLVDGADAARFLTAVKQRLEDANFESELGA